MRRTRLIPALFLAAAAPVALGLPVSLASPADAAGVGALVFNEFQLVPGDGDHVELYNTSSDPVYLSGLKLHVELPGGADPRTVDLGVDDLVPGHGYDVVAVRLQPNDIVSLPGGDRHSLPYATTATSYGQCPDGAGGPGNYNRWVRTTEVTLGAPNKCNVVLINEVDATPTDALPFIELVNTGETPQDLTGSRIENGGDTLDLTGVLGPGQIAVYRMPIDPRFDRFGYQAIPGWVSDEISWGSDAPPVTSWQRCPDGAGQPMDDGFVVSPRETPGEPNVCLQLDTTTRLDVQPTVSTYGAPVVLTATVTDFRGVPGTVRGTVRFTDGDTVLGTASIGDSGTATLTVDQLGAGVRQVRAAYLGSVSFSPSTSDAVSVEVAKAPTTLTASPVSRRADPVRGGPRAVLISPSGPVAGAALEFRTGSGLVCRATTDAAGVASCNGGGYLFAVLLAGGYTVTYAGDANHLPSTAHGSVTG